MAKTATRKGGGEASMVPPLPPHSFPTRQKKLGPAPFASFEDLSDDNDGSPPDPEACKLKPMPEIKEDGIRSPDEEDDDDEEETGNLQFGGVTVIPSTGTTIASSSSVPTSGPTSGLQTPSTPRIDISCASSSTPPSEESNSERELFQGGLGLSFHEDGADDLRSSTEELEYGVDDDIHDERRKTPREPDDPFRRASHPANIFQRKASMTPTDEDFLSRKPSAHSLYLEGFLSRPCRHSSFGSADRQRPGAISSLSADGRRSASPHKMLLETSFCGSKPIPTPSMDLDSPPRAPAEHGKRGKKKAGPAPNENLGMLSSDSSFESHPTTPRPQKLTTLTTVQVHHHDHHPTTASGSEAQATASPSPRAESRTPLQFPSPESPKSSDHWRPISPRPAHTSTSPSNANDTEAAVPKEAPASSWSPPTAPSKKDSTQSPIQLTMNRNSVKSHKTHESSSSTSSPVIVQREVKQVISSVSITTEKVTTVSQQVAPGRKVGPSSSSKPNDKLSSSASPGAATKGPTSKGTPKTTRKKIFAQDLEPLPPPPPPPPIESPPPPPPPPLVVSKAKPGSKAASSNGTKNTTKGKAVPEKKPEPPSSKSAGGGAAARALEKDEITTEMKITEDAFVPVEDAPIESKGFFQEDSQDDDDELPYVPTTLPLEKSVVVPIIPIKERRKLGTMVTTKPTQRPRCVRPPNPASLNDFIANSSNPPRNSKQSNSPSNTKADSTTKMKINLPRDDSLPDSSAPPKPKSPKKKLPQTSWTDFAEMGLRSPREIRRRMREENGATDDTSAYHSDSSLETAGPVNGGSDDETESLLKLPKVPFAMDLDVRSNRSSVVSQEEPPPSPGSISSAPLEVQDETEDEP